MATLTKKFHSDGGHGWLAVKKTELQMLGIESTISEFSYQRGGTVYLEEDSDAPAFINAARDRGIKVEFSMSPQRDRSPIRSMASYEV
jgi:hypothetical protein